MTTLIAAGDSFTYGSELPDCAGRSSKLTWSALLAERNGWDYLCIAKPGCGNQSIARRVIDAVSTANEPVVVAVMWTMLGRREVGISPYIASKLSEHEYNQQDLDGNWINLNIWQTQDYDSKRLKFNNPDQWFNEKLRTQCDLYQQHNIKDLATHYFNTISQEDHIRSSCESIYILQNFLKNRSVPVIFANVTDDLQAVFTNGYLGRDLDRSDWITLQGFNDWSTANKYESSPMGHPPEEAHRQWLNEHYKYIKQDIS